VRAGGGEPETCRVDEGHDRNEDHGGTWWRHQTGGSRVQGGLKSRWRRRCAASSVPHRSSGSCQARWPRDEGPTRSTKPSRQPGGRQSPVVGRSASRAMWSVCPRFDVTSRERPPARFGRRIWSQVPLTCSGRRRTMVLIRVSGPGVRKELDDAFGELARGGWTAASVTLARPPKVGVRGAS
jgi:hypothetical protein